MGNYNDTLMEQLANDGDGFYAYVDSMQEAERIFVDKLTGSLLTIAQDAKIQVEFNPETVERYRLVGYENRDVADDDFRNDEVDAGEIGAGHSVTALYELELLPGIEEAKSLVATVRLRWEEPGTGEVIELEQPFTLGDWPRLRSQCPTLPTCRRRR
jgi:Ca-activated chloride channel family protein